MLHDDFYDDDGTATQPEEDVVDADSYPAPTLCDVCSSLDGLIDYIVSRWNPTKEEFEAFKVFHSSDHSHPIRPAGGRQA